MSLPVSLSERWADKPWLWLPDAPAALQGPGSGSRWSGHLVVERECAHVGACGGSDRSVEEPGLGGWVLARGRECVFV